MGMYTTLELNNLILDIKFKDEQPLLYAFLKLKHAYVNDLISESEFPYFNDEWDKHPNKIYHEINSLFKSVKLCDECYIRLWQNELYQKLMRFGNYNCSSIFIMTEDRENITITVEYETKCSPSIYVWLKWFLPYIKNSGVIGRVEYEDSDLDDHNITKESLTKLFNKYRGYDFEMEK